MHQAQRQTEMRVALITTDLAAINEYDRDAEPIIAALHDRNVAAQLYNWHTANPKDLAGFDAALIRSPWDYPEHLDSFLAWINAVAEVVPVHNCVETIRWNLDKSYLLELQKQGIPIVPTSVCASLKEVTRAVATAAESDRIVVKPNISVGSRDTGLFDRFDPAATALAAHIFQTGRKVIVQPAIPTVDDVGERAMICFDGKFSHAVSKGPILRHGGGMLGDQYTEVIAPVEATLTEMQLAERVVATISQLLLSKGCLCPDPTPLYARIDLVASNLGSALLEAELFEPSYFVDTCDGSAQRFANGVVERIATTRR